MDNIVANLEFPRPIDVSDLPAHGLDISVQATPAEREALCRRFELVELRTLEARIRVERARDGDGGAAIRVQAELHGEVTHQCVVSLEPFPVEVDEEFSILFQFSATKPGDSGDLEDVMAENSPEPLDTPEIDVGELVAQHMALALDPYPRGPGARLELSAEEAHISDLAARPDNPFAILGQLKHKM
ncbi:MAG: DUF177 domain-containing protein [Proteobacteria bacterium]|nr:DUF177 domain-containing protein [Pseudomonadota bacterium]MDA1356806.1 DUF177 domain-containing protein [Pseudomonadota bacterium]